MNSYIIVPVLRTVHKIYLISFRCMHVMCTHTNYFIAVKQHSNAISFKDFKHNTNSSIYAHREGYRKEMMSNKMNDDSELNFKVSCEKNSLSTNPS